MGVTVTITWVGLDNAISRFSKMGEQTLSNIAKQTDAIAKDGEEAWRAATPVRTGRLRGGDVGEAGGLTITFRNATRYYDWVSEGHMTPAGWHTRRGYRPAKRRSHVAGRQITEKLVTYLDDNIGKYLEKALQELGD